MAELVTNNSTCVGQQGTNDILFKSQDEINVGPSLVAVLQGGHAEHQIVHIFHVAISLAFVTQAKSDFIGEKKTFYREFKEMAGWEFLCCLQTEYPISQL